MSAETAVSHHDDQSHYEISLTAGQAFVAFVLLLLSLAASFAFGLMIGRGQADERLVVRREPAVINEGSVLPKKKTDRIVELGVADDDFKQPEETSSAATPPAEEETTPSDAVIKEEAPPAVTEPAPATTVPEPTAPAVPHYAQLLSSSEQKAAEALAAKLIDRGFSTAYVERGSNEKGPIYRVRVKFPSEAEARAAEVKLKEFSKDVWITRQ